jgi:hypothetical protein
VEGIESPWTWSQARWSAIDPHAGSGWPVELESTWVTFTASRLDSSPSATVRPLGIEPSPAAYRAAARPSCYRRITSLCWSGWLDLPQRPPVPETGAHLPELHPEVGGRKTRGRACAPPVPSSGIEPAPPGLQPGAITRSATRASLWPGWCPATGIVDYSIVRERFRCATKLFGDEDSNLDEQGQSLLACH